ncbi:N-acetyltransferase family protein [Streptomyces sp. JNUCC 64]
MVHTRVLSTDDWPLWRDARRAALADSPHAFTSRPADWHRGGEVLWRARFETPGTHNVVALLHGRVVGMARGVPAPGGTARELRSVWVDPDARGRGVGDLLLTTVERWARRTGAAELTLTVIQGNERALALYRRNGFVPHGAEAPLPEGTGQRTLVKFLRP